MGDDGAKRVVVNSVGREIRDARGRAAGRRQAPAADDRRRRPEGIEDAFKASGFNGAAVVLDPANGDVLGFTSRPSYDPNAFAAGIDRATWASLNTDELRPLQDRAIQGRYSPGSTFKMAVALAALEEGIITPDFHAHCAGHANFYGHDFKCWKSGRARLDRSAARDRAVLRRLLLHRREHGRRRQDQQVGDDARPRRQERHRPAQRTAGARAVDRVEAREDAREVVRRRNHLGRHRPGRGVGHAGVDGRLHGDAGQWRHPGHAAPAQGGGRRQRLEAGAAAAAAVEDRHRSRQAAGDSRRALDGGERRAGPAAARASPVTTSRARPDRRR